MQHEDYLLGKEIGKNESDPPQHAIPVVSRRVVGSSMTKTLDDTQVDLVRKLREDPLLLVKERERAARAALLSNPLQRKRLADLLRLEKVSEVKYPFLSYLFVLQMRLTTIIRLKSTFL